MLDLTLTWRCRRWHDLTAAELYRVVKLRQDVFIVEQACAYPDLDGTDPSAWHLLGDRAGELIAYLRFFGPGILRPEAVIGRVITAGSVRGQGVGRLLMERGADACRERFGPAPIHLGAQVRQQGFYESLGYRVSGPGYDEDGIPHVPMRLNPA